MATEQEQINRKVAALETSIQGNRDLIQELRTQARDPTIAGRYKETISERIENLAARIETKTAKITALRERAERYVVTPTYPIGARPKVEEVPEPKPYTITYPITKKELYTQEQLKRLYEMGRAEELGRPGYKPAFLEVLPEIKKEIAKEIEKKVAPPEWTEEELTRKGYVYSEKLKGWIPISAADWVKPAEERKPIRFKDISWRDTFQGRQLVVDKFGDRYYVQAGEDIRDPSNWRPLKEAPLTAQQYVESKTYEIARALEKKLVEEGIIGKESVLLKPSPIVISPTAILKWMYLSIALQTAAAGKKKVKGKAKQELIKQEKKIKTELKKLPPATKEQAKAMFKEMTHEKRVTLTRDIIERMKPLSAEDKQIALAKLNALLKESVGKKEGVRIVQEALGIKPIVKVVLKPVKPILKPVIKPIIKVVPVVKGVVALKGVGVVGVALTSAQRLAQRQKMRQETAQLLGLTQAQQQKLAQEQVTKQAYIQKIALAVTPVQKQSLQQKQLQQQRQISRQVVRTTLGLKEPTVAITVTPPTPVPKIPKPIIAKLPEAIPKPFLAKPRVVPFAVAKSYVPLVKHKKKWLRVTKKPMRREAALDVAAEAVDRTASARFKITPSKKEPSKIKATGYFRRTRHKFRGYKIRKKAKIPLREEYIEKTAHRIDTPGEIRGITAKGWIAKKKKARTGRLPAPKPFFSRNPTKSTKKKTKLIGKSILSKKKSSLLILKKKERRIKWF